MIRDLFASTPDAKAKAIKRAGFSFNVKGQAGVRLRR